MTDRPDERIGMKYDVPEPYDKFLARTGLPADSCTFCKGRGQQTPPAFVVRRRWNGRELGQLLSYCDAAHHFDPRGGFYSSGTDDTLKETCPVHTWNSPSPGSATTAERDDAYIKHHSP